MAKRKRVVVESAYGIGGLLAAIVSWTINKSVLWAMVHLFFGWFYIMYACCAHTDRLNRAVHSLENGR